MTIYRYSENWFNASEITHGPLSTTWVQLNTTFRAISVIIENHDTSNKLQFSFDGTNIHGYVKPNSSIHIMDKNISKIWVKSALNSIPSWQIFAW